MLVNRLRGVLKDLVSGFQNAFVPSRLISDNILIAHEIIEHIRRKKRGKHSFFALKLDMNKAYDLNSCWDFLLEVMRAMGFSQMWVNWIHQCISTVSFSVMVNGSRSKSFQPSCGIRQGDPLSPYLFILVAQALSEGLLSMASNGICKGIAVSRRSPSINHLLFADDCFLLWNLSWSTFGV